MNADPLLPRSVPTVRSGAFMRSWLVWALGCMVLVLNLLAPRAEAAGTWIETGADGRPEVHLYFFWSLRCPHCLEARPFVEAIPAGRAAALTGSARDVARSLPTPELKLPLVGRMETDALSLPVMTVLIAGLDAFNPCAFFVLLFLLSLMLHQNNRARMLSIGGVFVLCSGLMYFAFMAAWLNLFQLLDNLAWVTLAAGLMAIAVGLINVKDFFRFGRGVSLSIPQSRKPGLYRRARAILAAGNVPAMLAATLLLAVAANFYELLCTAGFPMVYTRLLTLQDLGATQHYLYLALYNVVYVIPLAVIVGVFAFTMGARRLSEREGRLLKLMSGLMMLQLGILLVLAPDGLNRLGVAFALLGVALGVTWLVARLART